jgi:hypothetical protein
MPAQKHPAAGDSRVIRDQLIGALRGQYPTTAELELEAVQRNAFCMRLGNESPIFTVTVTYGGTISPTRPEKASTREGIELRNRQHLEAAASTLPKIGGYDHGKDDAAEDARS